MTRKQNVNLINIFEKIVFEKKSHFLAGRGSHLKVKREKRKIVCNLEIKRSTCFAIVDSSFSFGKNWIGR